MTVSRQSSYNSSIKDQRAMAFDRVRRVFRWTTAGAVAAVALIVGVVANEIPGRSSSAAPAASAPPNAGGSSVTSGSPTTGATAAASAGSSVSSSSSATSSPSAGAISTPQTLPVPTRKAPTVVSGGTSW